MVWRHSFRQGEKVRFSSLVITAFLLFAVGCVSAPKQTTSSSQSSKGGDEHGPRANPHYKVGIPYKIKGKRYVPREDENYSKTGIASWYGDQFQGRLTANGEVFDKNLLSAAHKTLPLPSYVEVKNLENGRRLTVRVNDRGPFVDDRIIDLSEAAARELGFEGKGLAKVKVRFAGYAPLHQRAAAPQTATQQVRLAQSRDASARFSSEPRVKPRSKPVAVDQTPRLAPPGVSPGAKPAPRVTSVQNAATSQANSEESDANLPPREDPIATIMTTEVETNDAYWVEIAEFDGLDALEKAELSLATLGSVMVQSETGEGGSDVFVVKLGPYTNLGEASRAQERALGAGFPAARLMAGS